MFDKKEYDREYYLKIENAFVKDKESGENNKEEKARRDRLYYENNKEEKTEYNRKFYSDEKNREHKR